jgi:hypothetical protein
MPTEEVETAQLSARTGQFIWISALLKVKCRPLDPLNPRLRTEPSPYAAYAAEEAHLASSSFPSKRHGRADFKGKISAAISPLSGMSVFVNAVELEFDPKSLTDLS